jgi:hypothetical protein
LLEYEPIIIPKTNSVGVYGIKEYLLQIYLINAPIRRGKATNRELYDSSNA